MARELLFKDGKLRYADGDILSNDTFLAEYNECLTKLTDVSETLKKVPKETENVVLGAFHGINIMSSVCLCASICEFLDKAGSSPDLSEFFGDMTEPENNRIAYMRNSYSDLAYRIFADALGQATVVYPDSFSSVCEEVYYGRAGYCILPYESSDDGALLGFLKLIDKYELAPVMTAGIVTDPDPEVQKVTFFVLLAKNVKRISGELEARGIKSEEYLKINVDAPSGNAVSDVMNAARYCGLSYVKTESLPVMWDSGRYVFSITFKVDDADLLPFLLWLKLSMPESTPHAVYAYLLF